MKPARYIFINRGLDMSPGKIAAQASHSETLAMHDYFDTMIRVHELDPDDMAWGMKQEQLYSKWFGYGHYAKYVMKANDSTQMFTTERYLKDRGFRTYMVVDEGHTEDTWMVPTALSVELVDKDEERISEVFGSFRMYKPKPAQPLPELHGPRDTTQPQLPPVKVPKPRILFWRS